MEDRGGWGGGGGGGGTPIYKLHRAAFQLSDHIKHGKKKLPDFRKFITNDKPPK